VRHIAVVINKMDLVGFDRRVFAAIRAEFDAYARAHGVDDVVAIPISALDGDNVVTRSPRTNWYDGPTLLQHLEAVPVGSDPAHQPFRFPVQVVIRPQDAEHHDYRGYAGRVEAGIVSVGDPVVIAPAGARSRVVAIDTYDGPLAWAQAGQSITVRLADDIDISRGDLIAAAHAAPAVVRDVSATVTVLAEQALVPHQRLLLKAGSRTVRAVVEAIDSRLDVDTLDAQQGVDRLGLNDIGDVRIRLAEPVAFDPYDQVRSTGAFLLIDDQSGATVAAGMVRTTAA
jgi:sulfate adenylyltransferase subunit 1